MALKSIKRSVSFSDKVNQWAEELAEQKGFDNFSAYLADLVRRDKEREDALKSGLPPESPEPTDAKTDVRPGTRDKILKIVKAGTKTGVAK